jgi:signal transduction histidine kinase
MRDEMIVAITDRHVGLHDAHIGVATQQRKPTQVPDIREMPSNPLNEINLREGYRALLIVPLLRPDHIVGALVVRRKTPGEFPQSTIDLLETFADQSVVAIQNANLFHEIEEKGKQLAIASQHKSQFLANMSHELRTPLNAIIGFSEIMASGMFGPLGADRYDEYCRDIHSSGQYLLDVINDVLDMSKIEAGRMRLDHERLALDQLLADAMRVVSSRAAEKRLALALDVEADTAFEADRRACKQVILNLLSNAVKFTPDGGRVDVRGRTRGDWIVMAIEDTGIGIPYDALKRLGRPFEQVESQLTKSHQGSGSPGRWSSCTAASCASARASAPGRP